MSHQSGPEAETIVPERSAPVEERPGPAGYELLGELGRGGMGVVYKARQIRLNRTVALKMILGGAHASVQELDRFRAEAEAVAQLQHPNIVQVYEVGEQDGHPFFSLEYVDGGSLAQQISAAPPAPTQAAAWVETLARAVHAAHQRGVIHRDLKPANVLLTADGTPKITDFGLAKRLDVEKGQTQSGSILGTPSYMAPEQAGGQVKDIGPAVDVYALGAVLYELLTGRPPFRAESPLDTLLLVISAEPVPPSRLHPKLPRDLETICLKCLEKEPRKRYPSAEALADDLRRFQAHEPISARPVGVVGRLVKWARRRPAIAALSGLSLLLAVAGFAGVVWQWRQTEGQRRQAVAALHEVQTAHYFNRVGLADREFQANNVALARRLLDECPENRRRWEWRYLRGLMDPSHGELRGHAGPVNAVAFTLDSRRLASAGADGTVRVWDPVEGRELLTLKGHTGPVECVAVSPDGKLLASGGQDKTVRLWDAADGRAAATLAPQPAAVGRVQFSADGRSLAVATRDAKHTVRLWEVEGHKPGRVVGEHRFPVTGLAFSRDGRRLATSSGDLYTQMPGEMRVWDVASGKLVRELTGHIGPVFGVDLSPDSRKLVAACNFMDAVVWDVDTGQAERSLYGHSNVLSAVAFNRPGTQLATGGWDGAVRVWDAPSGRPERTYRGHSNWVQGLAFSPDGRRLASAGKDHVVRVWDTESDQEALLLYPQARGAMGLAFSPDGSRLATAGQDGTVKVLDAGGAVGLTLKAFDVPCMRVAFSPDGRYLAACGSDWLQPRRVGEVRVWNAATGQELSRPGGHRAGLGGVLFAADGRLLTVCYDGQLRFWDAAAGQPGQTIQDAPGPLVAPALSPDGRRLAVGRLDRAVAVWDVASGARLHRLAMPHAVWAVAFSPDGKLLAVGGGDQQTQQGFLTLLDAATGKDVVSTKAHFGMVLALDFHPTEPRLAAGGADGTVLLVDTTELRLALTLRGHVSGVAAVAFSPDGRRLVSAGRDRSVRFWETAPAE